MSFWEEWEKFERIIYSWEKELIKILKLKNFCILKTWKVSNSSQETVNSSLMLISSRKDKEKRFVLCITCLFIFDNDNCKYWDLHNRIEFQSVMRARFALRETT